MLRDGIEYSIYNDYQPTRKLPSNYLYIYSQYTKFPKGKIPPDSSLPAFLLYGRDEWGRDDWGRDEWGRGVGTLTSGIRSNVETINTYNTLLDISLGKEPVNLCLLYINNDYRLLAKAARMMLSTGHQYVHFMGPDRDESGKSLVYKKEF